MLKDVSVTNTVLNVSFSNFVMIDEFIDSVIKIESSMFLVNNIMHY